MINKKALEKNCFYLKFSTFKAMFNAGLPLYLETWKYSEFDKLGKKKKLKNFGIWEIVKKKT